MTIKELQKRRRNGASLEILADLANCTVAEIKEALGHSDGSYVADPSEVEKKVNYSFDTKEAMRLYEQGLSDYKIAERMGKTTQTIWGWRKNEDLLTNNEKYAKRVAAEKIAELHAEGLLPAEICERLDISEPAYYRWKKKAGVPNNRRPEWDREKTMRLYEQGLTDPEIAEQVGRSASLICKWRKANNLPPNGVPGSDRRWCAKEAMELYEQGYIDREIGEQVGASVWTIGDWRRRKGLRANGRRRVSR